jgi:hypothetical protein
MGSVALCVNGFVDLSPADDLAGLYSLASRSDEPGVPCSPMVHARRSPRFTQSAPEPNYVSGGAENMSVIFGGVAVPQAVEHVDVGFGAVGSVLSVDEPVPLEVLFCVEVVLPVGQVVLVLA